MSETLFQVLRMYQCKTHQTCILVETSNIDTYFLSALRKNKAGLRCEDRSTVRLGRSGKTFLDR